MRYVSHSNATEAFDNLRALLEVSSPSVVARHPEWVIDALLGPVVSASNTIVVSGFWRSGTSILLEVICRTVGAKAVFEPFRPGNKVYDRILHQRRVGGACKKEPFVPFWNGKQDWLFKYVRRAMTGATPGVFVRASRRSIREEEGRVSSSAVMTVLYRVLDAVRRQVVLKSVRTHLILPFIKAAFSPRCIVHIRRDPRAVVASLKRKGWNWFRDVSLSELLLSPTDGRRVRFEPIAEKIIAADQKGEVARCAAYWSILERTVLDSDIQLVNIRYENLCCEGVSYLEGQLGFLLGHAIDPVHLTGGSASTIMERRVASIEERIHGWKTSLSVEDAKTVEETIASFGMEAQLNDDSV